MEQPIQAIEQIVILTVPHRTFKQRLAISEMRRGLYRLGYKGRVVVGELPGPSPEAHTLHIVLMAGRAIDEHYTLSCSGEEGTHDEHLPLTLTIHGASEQGLLYGIFDFLERQGAYFGLDGDSYPLDRVSHLHLPDPNHPWRGRPAFATRGLQPWPDFLNCITSFNREDYRAYLEAMLRMRFNTLGIHVYGQRDKWVESFLSFEYGGVGHASFTDTTATDRWGYLPQRTSRFGLSADQYFDGEVFGADATRHACSPWEAAEMAQTLWREAFAYAEQLGIRTGVGFEPYQLPDEIVRACPPEVRRTRRLNVHGHTRDFTGIDPTSRTARTLLETRLAQLLEAYPSVSYIYLWEDESTNWASQHEQADLPLTVFKQAYDFLQRHAPEKRLVLAGWGGITRNFARFHRALPEDIIFACLSDQFGWDPVHTAFSQLENRERWPILWIEDDPSMWFPQLHVHRFARDMALANDYGCQGIFGIHWRHRIVDPVAGFLARRSWDHTFTPTVHYDRYASIQASGKRKDALATLLSDADEQHHLLATWTGETREDGHMAYQELAGDYSEAFLYHANLYPDIDPTHLTTQKEVITQLGQLLTDASTPAEREQLAYLYGQIQFLDPYAQAWRTGAQLQRLLEEQQVGKQQGEEDAVSLTIQQQAIPLWIELLGYVRSAVLAFQHTVATRHDQGMLASIHNKFVRIATFRLRASLLEFVDELPAEAEQAVRDALAPDDTLPGSVFVPTRPTRLSIGDHVLITAVAPGAREPSSVVMCQRLLEKSSWERKAMHLVGRRTYRTELYMPLDVNAGIEYYIEASFAGAPQPFVVTAPSSGRSQAYVVTV